MRTINYVLSAVFHIVYKYAGAALLLTVGILFAVLYARDKGVKGAFVSLLRELKNSRKFLRTAVFALYISFMLFTTVLTREFYSNPLCNVWGMQEFYDTWHTWLNPEWIENIILFIPMGFFRLDILKDKFWVKPKFISVLCKSAVISFIGSLIIETVQLITFSGTFQLTDLMFNTAGGLIGGLLYYVAFLIYRGVNKLLKVV